MFALIGAVTEGVSVKCPDIETAEMLKEAGVARDVRYLHKSWVRLPEDTEPASSSTGSIASYELIRAKLPADRAPEPRAASGGVAAMFPKPIEKASPGARVMYQTALPIALIIWLLPLIGIAVTSFRPASDLAAGNYFGLPSQFAIWNYADVFRQSPMGHYIFNSFRITIPAVIGAVALSCLTGFALSTYRFRGNLVIFFIFVAGNFVPFQILMVPVRDLTLKLGLYDTVTGLVLFHVAFQTGFCTLFMRNFIKALPFELLEFGARRGRLRVPHLLVHRAAPDAAGDRRAFGADLHLRLERLFLGAGADPGRLGAAGDGRPLYPQRPVGRLLAARLGRRHRRRHAAGADVLPDAEALHRGADTRGDERIDFARCRPIASMTRRECWRLDTAAQTLVLASFAGRLPVVAYWGAPLAPGRGPRRADARRCAGRSATTCSTRESTSRSARRKAAASRASRASMPSTAQGRPVLTQFVCRKVESLRRLARRRGARPPEPAHLQGALPGVSAAETSSRPRPSSSRTASRSRSAGSRRRSFPSPRPRPASSSSPAGGRRNSGFAASPFTRGLHVRQNRRGRTGQDHFPAIIVPERGTTDLAGEARALHFGFSGVHRLLAEEMADGRRQIQAGVAEAAHLRPGGTVRSQTAYLAFSGEGLNGIAGACQAHVRDRIVRFRRAGTAAPGALQLLGSGLFPPRGRAS